jgi:hypothetical protein
MDRRRGHPALTYSMAGSMDMQHGHAARICSMETQTYRMDMDMQHEHGRATWI